MDNYLVEKIAKFYRVCLFGSRESDVYKAAADRAYRDLCRTIKFKDKDDNRVIFDLKWSDSSIYPDKIKKGEAYQLYMYKHAVEAQTGKTVAWYAYYLFPKMELYTEPAGVSPKWEEWIQKRKDRLDQLSKGIIEPAVKDSDREKYPKHMILKNLKMK